MSKRHKRNRSTGPSRAVNSQSRGRVTWIGLLVFVGIGAATSIWFSQRGQRSHQTNSALAVSSNTPVATPLPTNEVAQSLMVTVELDFGKTLSFKDALKEIERRYQPDDGVGRTFAILDAYGQTNSDGKLHISMHLSMEKPGVGSLIFRRTGEELWKSRIVPWKTTTPQEKRLRIFMDDTEGKSVVLDGSKGAAHVLDVPLQDSTTLVREVWPDGAEHEFTFIYSVCGCPVKVKVRRVGETTVRTGDHPVMFPDDPAAMETIGRLMGWPVQP
jgi:hypothetical protein